MVSSPSARFTKVVKNSREYQASAVAPQGSMIANLTDDFGKNEQLQEVPLRG